MDWESIANQLSHEAQPALAVDSGGRVRVVNASLEKLVSRRLDELSTKRWLVSCVPPSGWAGVKRLFDAGLRGEARDGDVPLLTRGGRRLIMHAELSRAVRGRSRALIVVGRDLRETEPMVSAVGDCWCVIERGATGPPVIRTLRFLDPSRDASTLVGGPPSELMRALSASDALQTVEDIVAKSSAEATSVILPDADDAFRIVTARTLDERAVLVTIRYVDAALLPELVDAPNNATSRVRLYAAAATALMRWEPRLKLTRVQLSTDVSETGAGVQVLDIEGTTTVSGDLVSTRVQLSNGGAA